jgi:hypothetical protein
MTAEAISVEVVFKIAGSNPLCSICHHLSFDTAVETLSCLVQQFVWRRIDVKHAVYCACLLRNTINQAVQK